MVKGYDNCMLKKYNITKLFNDFGERCCDRSTSTKYCPYFTSLLSLAVKSQKMLLSGVKHHNHDHNLNLLFCFCSFIFYIIFLCLVCSFIHPYFKYNSPFLSNVVIIKTKVLLPKA